MDPHASSARLCLNTEVFILPSPGWCVSWVGPLGTPCPGCPRRERVPAVPARRLPHTVLADVTLASSVCKLSLSIFLIYDGASGIFQM